MRILLLGSLRGDQDFKRRFVLIKRKLKRFVEQNLGESMWRREIDLVCFWPNYVGDGDGVEFVRFENHARILIDLKKNPSSSNILATMLQVLLFYWFDDEKKSSYSNQFLFDLYKTGASLYLVNKLTGANWYSDDLDEATFKRLKQIASDILSGKTVYDENFWLDCSGQNYYFILWFFGERIVKEIISTTSLSWRDVSQPVLQKYFNQEN